MTQALMTGQVAMITGAGSGIGRAAALKFAQAGARVVLGDVTGAEEETAEMVRAAGGQAASLRMDAGQEPDVIAGIELAQKEFGRLDAVFANAGITGTTGGREFLEHTPEAWAEVLRVNLIGPFLAIKHAVPVMKAQGGGSIVATASVAGIRANAGPVAYSASKAGVMNLVQTAAQDLRGTGIRVNAICPGLVETGMTKLYYDFARATGNEQRLGHTNPMERGGQPEEIADVALFLCSPMASFVNGQALPVDGGLSSGHPTGPKIDPKLVERVLAAKRAETAG
ncbi:SDR family oxidoreductase [Seohaeicola saemankumensis]|nr:SDR family NAD(P)-dependent oxidoreductase [Seohaeicola saemankumensis]MCA0873572.1 SDR family oxidoreductase [Seohaeicola saemankumensis]